MLLKETDQTELYIADSGNDLANEIILPGCLVFFSIYTFIFMTGFQGVFCFNGCDAFLSDKIHVYP